MSIDPRPDLSRDSLAWSRLLQGAYATDGAEADGLFGVLHGFRCLGAELESWRGGMRLSRGEIGLDEYDEWRRRYLVPHRSALTELLREAA